MADSQRPLRLLSLDGGGIRGLSSLYILRNIMTALSQKTGSGMSSPCRPCDYFDLIAGTSTGGLIAIMLGTLRMDVETCINEYLDLSPKIFPVEGLTGGSTLGRMVTIARGRQRFNPEPLEHAIKALVKKYLREKITEGGETSFKFEASKFGESHSCRVFVCATSEKLGKPFRFRSYNSTWDDLDDCPIWQACRATSAAPTFFPPMVIGNPPVAYVDGGMGSNNPIRALIEESSHIWPSNRRIGSIVSIGTGVLISRDVGRTFKPLFDKIVEMATNTEEVAREFEEEMKYRYGIDQKVYFRFNVQNGLEHVGLEEWKEMDRTKVATQNYLKIHWSRIQLCSSQIFDLNTPTFFAGEDDRNWKYRNTTAEEIECLRLLYPKGIDYQSQKDQNPARVPNTCLWTLNNPKYTEWRDSDTKKLLWISADPGCGKSVLTRCIIDEDLPQAFQNGLSPHVLYYFFKDTSPEQRSASRAISTILHQLFVSQPSLIRHALHGYREKGEALCASFSQLWSIFTAVVTDPLAGYIICIFDALDECDEQEQLELIKALEGLCLHRRTLSSISNFKFLLTSRPYFQIKREFDNLLRASENIELAGNEESASIKQEIDLVIQHRVKELTQENRLAEKVSNHLRNRLLATENRTYLWLRLVWGIIKKNMSGTIVEMNKTIDNLPSGIQDSYEALLRRCPEPLFAKKVLQIVLVAGRPLTLDEIDLALNINEQTTSYADLDLEGSARLQETLPSRCGLMVSIIQSKVYFIHQTVKEFLLVKGITEPPVRRIWQQSLDLEESHHLMAEICLKSITLLEIRIDQADLCNALLPEDLRRMQPNAYCQGHLFLSYSTIFWADHAGNRMSREDMKTIGYILENSLHIIRGRCGNECGTILHAASAGGHKEIVQLLLKNGTDVNANGGKYGTALTAASAKGHVKIVQLLLNDGADVNVGGGFHGTALVMASEGGYENIVQLLLNNGADVNAEGGVYGIALARASAKGHGNIVQLLLNNGADVNAKGEFHGTALVMASGEGDENSVQLLLNNGADVNAEGGEKYGTALIAASTEGHKNIVQLLLNNGADVNAKGGYLGPALVMAAEKGHEYIVKLLLNNGADVNAEDGKKYGTALTAASTEGHKDIVQLLLNNGANIND